MRVNKIIPEIKPLLPENYFLKLLLLTSILTIVFVWSISTGSTNISFNELKNFLFNPSSLNQETYFIIYELRLARVVLGVIAGMSLALTGMILQAIFRNPLVDPFIIGISGGASLGAGIAIIFALDFTFLGISSTPIIAFLTAIISMLISYKLSLINKRMYIERLLLGGIAISSLTSSILSLLLVLKGQDANAVIFWIMGSLSGKGWESVKIILPYMILVNIISIFYLQKLNIMQLGEESALNLGLNTERLKLILIVISSLLASAVVSVSGVIGFIGLVVPHIARLLIKSSDFRFLYPVVLLLGAIILVGADTVSRIIMIPQEIPVGIFTSLLGVPFFLFLLKNNAKI
ncbi:MAG: iron ABC transporter permease [Candidatus Sericytochromatia bacterium]|nr:iron ABC transporter permease [Candidatus Sericytochromatia bacterium]